MSAKGKYDLGEETQVPTPERLRAANDNFTVDKKTGTYVFHDGPVERLYKQDKLTEHQIEAARRFYQDYYAAGMAPLGAQDYTRPVVDGRSPLIESDFRMGAAQRYNEACEALGSHFLKVVDRVVLREMNLEAAGKLIGYGNASQARVGALERLSGGLEVLAGYYKLVTKMPRSRKIG